MEVGWFEERDLQIVSTMHFLFLCCLMVKGSRSLLLLLHRDSPALFLHCFLHSCGTPDLRVPRFLL